VSVYVCVRMRECVRACVRELACEPVGFSMLTRTDTHVNQSDVQLPHEGATSIAGTVIPVFPCTSFAQRLASTPKIDPTCVRGIMAEANEHGPKRT
jgi:hypothetical protein